MEFDIFKIDEDSISIKAEAGKISSHRKSLIQRNGVRRFENEKVFQTSRLGEASFDRLIQDTKEWGGLGVKHDFGFAPKHTEIKKYSVASESSLSSYTEALEYLTSKYPEFVFSGQCNILNKKVSLTSSYGVDLTVEGGAAEWYFIYQKKGSGNMMDGYIFGTNQKDTILGSVKNQEFYIAVSDKKVKLKSGQVPILFVDEKAPLKKLLESLHINKYSENSALYSQKLGQKLFSDKVTLVDSSSEPNLGQIMFFDGEGVVRNTDHELIKNGQFVNLISDLRFGKKFNSISSGNGIRPYNRGVNLDFRNLKFKKLNRTWNTILKDLPLCIVALVTAGGDSNDLGEYSTPVQIGYVYEYGELVGVAPQITVKSSVDQYLGKNLIDISSDGFISDLPSACVISEMEVLVN